MSVTAWTGVDGTTGPTLTVEAAFSTAVGGGGVWDSSTWDSGLWGPDMTWTDITGYVQRVQIRRGRQRSTERYESGSCTIQLDNRDGRFSPANLAGAYAAAGVTGVRPWRPIRITATYSGVTYPLYRGYALSWDETYGELGTSNVVQVRCVDELAKLAGFNQYEQTEQGAGERSGARMVRILNNTGSTAERQIEEGAVTCQGTTLAANAMTELLLTADSEGGAMWVEPDGAVWFEGRYALIQNSRSRVSQATWTDQTAARATYLRLDGTAGTYADTPDSATFTTSGMLDLRIVVSVDDWTNATEQALLSHYTTGGNQRSWYFRKTTAAQTINLVLSTDGTATSSHTATVTVPDMSGRLMALRAVWNGTAATPSVTFYYRIDSLVTAANAYNVVSSDAGWVQLGSTITASVPTSIHDSTTVLAVGMHSSASNRLTGSVYAAAVRRGINAISAPVFAFDTYDLDASGSTFTAETGQTVTLHGAADLIGTTSDPVSYSDIATSYDGDLVCNIAAMGRTGGTQQVYADAASRALYGDRAVSRTDLVCESDTQCLGLAEWEVERRKETELRVDSVTFLPQGKPATIWPQALGRRIRDQVTVLRYPFGLYKIRRPCFVEGVEHRIELDSWSTTFALSSASAYVRFGNALWDSAVWDADPFFI